MKSAFPTASASSIRKPHPRISPYRDAKAGVVLAVAGRASVCQECHLGVLREDEIGAGPRPPRAIWIPSHVWPASFFVFTAASSVPTTMRRASSRWLALMPPMVRASSVSRSVRIKAACASVLPPNTGLTWLR